MFIYLNQDVITHPNYQSAHEAVNATLKQSYDQENFDAITVSKSCSTLSLFVF